MDDSFKFEAVVMGLSKSFDEDELEVMVNEAKRMGLKLHTLHWKR